MCVVRCGRLTSSLAGQMSLCFPVRRPCSAHESCFFVTVSLAIPHYRTWDTSWPASFSRFGLTVTPMTMIESRRVKLSCLPVERLSCGRLHHFVVSGYFAHSDRQRSNQLADAILSVAEDKMTAFSDADPEILLMERRSGKPRPALRSADLESITIVFEFLLMTPPESLTRSFVATMSRRALALDILLEHRHSNAIDTLQWHGQLVLRSFLRRTVILTDDIIVCAALFPLF
jgi:hypothetical protein